MNYADLASPQNIPQTQPLNDRQVPNNGGGYAFAVDKWKRLERFLILGSDKPTYYQGARELTRENAKVVEDCWMEDAGRTCGIIVNISKDGRAPKNDPAIFALVLGALSTNFTARQFALSPITINAVCRTGTHILQFVAMAKQMGKGFGRGMKRAVASWYMDKDVDKLAYQVIKYRNREGQTHERLIKMARPKPESEARHGLLGWVVGKDTGFGLPRLVIAHQMAMGFGPDQKSALLGLLKSEPSLPWEALPTWANADADVQRQLLPNMGLTALIRNLGNLTRLGVLNFAADETKMVVDRLTSAENIRSARVHPLQILVAMKVYASGRPVTALRAGAAVKDWQPVHQIVAALDTAFHLAFDNVEVTGKRFFIGMDVSGSMSQPVAGNDHLTCAEATAAMALITFRKEPKTFVGRFAHEFQDVNFHPNSSLNDAMIENRHATFGHTDCALPMLIAMRHKMPVDVFMVLTDNETNMSSMHPMEALRMYRRATGINAKLVVVGMSSAGFTIADPEDDGCLDVVGFDTAAPAVIADFIRD